MSPYFTRQGRTFQNSQDHMTEPTNCRTFAGHQEPEHVNDSEKESEPAGESEETSPNEDVMTECIAVIIETGTEPRSYGSIDDSEYQR
jgi:hypothetical protein